MRGAAPGRRPLVGIAAAALSLFIAAVPISRGWESHDRRGNWIAHDYAYNMLAPLEPDAILFTNGDNDTFPLWYLQEVEGFRKDVRIVNLSLLNTPWYGEQLRDEEPRVPMRFSTEQIWQLRPMQDPNTGRIWYVKDIVGHDIVAAVREQGDERPVYFAVTVDNLLGFDDQLKLEGLVFRLDQTGQGAAGDTSLVGPPPEIAGDAESPEIVGDVNLHATRRNLEEVYKYRGLLNADGKLDETIYRDENERKLITNYAAAWARMALALRDAGRIDQAIECLQRAIEIAPDYDPIVGGFGGMLLESGDMNGAREFYLDRLRTNPEDVRVYLGLAYVARHNENVQEAVDWYHQGLSVAPGNRELLAGLFDVYYQAQRWDEAENILVQWLKTNPGDQSARSTLEELRRARAAAGQ
jgi:Flp pilus assembly protein TadD